MSRTMKFVLLCLVYSTRVCESTILIKFGRVSSHYRQSLLKGNLKTDPLEKFELPSRQLLCDSIIRAKQFMGEYYTKNYKKKNHEARVSLTDFDPMEYALADINIQRYTPTSQYSNPSTLMYKPRSTKIGQNEGIIKKRSIQCLNTMGTKWYIMLSGIGKFMYLLEPDKSTNKQRAKLLITGLLEPSAVIKNHPSSSYFYTQFQRSLDSMQSVCELGIDDRLRLCSSLSDTMSDSKLLKNDIQQRNHLRPDQRCVNKKLKVRNDTRSTKILPCRISGHQNSTRILFYVLADHNRYGAVFVFPETESGVLEEYTRVIRVGVLLDPTGKINRQYVPKTKKRRRMTDSDFEDENRVGYEGDHGMVEEQQFLNEERETNMSSYLHDVFFEKDTEPISSENKAKPRTVKTGGKQIRGISLTEGMWEDSDSGDMSEDESQEMVAKPRTREPSFKTHQDEEPSRGKLINSKDGQRTDMDIDSEDISENEEQTNLNTVRTNSLLPKRKNPSRGKQIRELLLSEETNSTNSERTESEADSEDMTDSEEEEGGPTNIQNPATRESASRSPRRLYGNRGRGKQIRNITRSSTQFYGNQGLGKQIMPRKGEPKSKPVLRRSTTRNRGRGKQIILSKNSGNDSSRSSADISANEEQENRLKDFPSSATMDRHRSGGKQIRVLTPQQRVKIANDLKKSMETDSGDSLESEELENLPQNIEKESIPENTCGQMHGDLSRGKQVIVVEDSNSPNSKNIISDDSADMSVDEEQESRLKNIPSHRMYGRGKQLRVFSLEESIKPEDSLEGENRDDSSKATETLLVEEHSKNTSEALILTELPTNRKRLENDQQRGEQRIINSQATGLVDDPGALLSHKDSTKSRMEDIHTGQDSNPDLNDFSPEKHRGVTSPEMKHLDNEREKRESLKEISRRNRVVYSSESDENIDVESTKNFSMLDEDSAGDVKNERTGQETSGNLNEPGFKRDLKIKKLSDIK